MNWSDVEDRLEPVKNWNSGPFNSHVGLRLNRWGPGAAEGILDLEAFHGNSLGVVHGGVSMTALDFAMGMSGCFAKEPENRRRCMTMSMNTNFIAPVVKGRLTIRAWVTGGGHRTFFPVSELRDEEGKLLVSASGVFKYLGDAAKS